MSKYTSELRFILETEGGLSESVGGNSVETVIATARTKVFDFTYPIFDENYRETLETKILRHYYTREIGQEVYGLWKLKLATKMNEIMPYYNQLYLSELYEFNPLYNVNTTKQGNRVDNGTLESEGTNATEGEHSNTLTDSRDNWTLDQETPQNGLTGVDTYNYLTSAVKNDDEETHTDNGTESSSSTSTLNNSTNDTREYLETIVGYNGSSASKLLLEYRDTFLNIDMQVINELKDLFMYLW